LIDYDFEARLVDRIAAREAIAAAGLTSKQRQVLRRYTRYGDTYREIASREGLSVERIRQHHRRSIDKLRAHLAKPDLPRPTTRNTPPPGFDKAAFLRHIRLLIELREQRALWEQQEQARREREEIERAAELEKREFERERDELARLIAGEKTKKPTPLAPTPFDSFTTGPPSPSLKIKLPVQYTVHPGYEPTHTVYNSPSYAPPPLPTEGFLGTLAGCALEYLLLARPQQFCGNPWLGKWATSVVFPRDGGSVSEGVNSIVRELPTHARLSAFPLPIEKGMLGANATTPYASLRITVTPDGLKLRIDVTWD
jgi:DNA-binding CsgD family transcriptional regulator